MCGSFRVGYMCSIFAASALHIADNARAKHKLGLEECDVVLLSSVRSRRSAQGNRFVTNVSTCTPLKPETNSFENFSKAMILTVKHSAKNISIN